MQKYSKSMFNHKYELNIKESYQSLFNEQIDYYILNSLIFKFTFYI